MARSPEDEPAAGEPPPPAAADGDAAGPGQPIPGEAALEPPAQPEPPLPAALEPGTPDPEPQPEPVAARAGEHEAPEDEPYRTLRLFDNPSVGRALRYTFGEKRLARAVFINALLMVVGLAVVQELYGRGQLGLYGARISYGRIAFVALVLVESLVLSVLAPLGAQHLFEAERREECFDQVVASGASPHRVVFGRYLATLAFVGVVLFSALPFFATTVVLDGASVGQVATAYLVLAGYAAALAAVSLACAVALDDVALPGTVAGLGCLLVLALGLGPRAQPVTATWSPVRHAVLDQRDIAQDLRLGAYRAPDPYGEELPCAPLSLAFYALAAFLGLTYAFVGPDMELGPGMDSFDSVTISPRQEATRARRGVARALLRAVQLRFFYENVSPRARALSPFLRSAVMVVLFAAAHIIFLGEVWPQAGAASFRDIAVKTAYPYLGFCGLSLGMVALAAGGARAALLCRTPVLALGPLRMHRFATLFLVVAVALAVPPALWFAMGQLRGLPEAVLNASELRGLYLLVAGYAAFAFSLALLMAMATSNPYSATGWTLIILFATNLIPAVWIPLFAGNVAGEGTAFLLDLSPLAAGAAIARPGETYPFTTFRDDRPVAYLHEPSWVPFLWFHLLLGVAFLVAGLVLARREHRRLRGEQP